MPPGWFGRSGSPYTQAGDSSRPSSGAAPPGPGCASSSPFRPASHRRGARCAPRSGPGSPAATSPDIHARGASSSSPARYEARSPRSATMASRRRPRDRVERAGRPARELRRVAHPNRDSRSERGLRLTPATRVVSRPDLPVVICVVDTPQYRTGWWPAVSPPPSAASSCSVLARSAIDDLPQPPRPALRRPRARGLFLSEHRSGRSTQRADACRSAPSSARDPSRASPTTVKIRARVARPPHDRARCLAASCLAASLTGTNRAGK